MKANDFLENTDGDLDIKNGDFVVGESDSDHIRDILEASPGHWKQFPLQGVNPPYFLNSRNTLQTLKNTIFEKLTMDGYIKVTTENLQITQAGTIAGNVNAQRK